MQIKGLDQLRLHVPGLRSPVRCLLIGLIPLISFAAGILFLNGADTRWVDYSIDGSVDVVLIGFLLIVPFFWQKKRLQSRYGEKAYRVAFTRYILTGLPLIFATIVHIVYMPGPAIPVGWWTLGFVLFGIYFAVVGGVLWLRAMLTFGVDNLTMLYVYFPDEGQVVNSSIYAIIRHPVYAGIVRLSLGLALLNGNWFALTFGLFLLLALTVWLYFVEEKELLERFGVGYTEYRKRVPAFWPRPRDVGKFFRFFILGK